MKVALKYLAGFIFIASIVFVGYIPKQSDFLLISVGFLVGFVIYASLILNYKSNQKLDLKFWLGIAIICRLALVFSFPNLSDDIYRFIWDGKLLLSGHSPFSILPSDALEMGIDGLSESLYVNLNSPNYYSIYPPISQGIYLFGALFADWYHSSIAMKIVLFTFEIGTILLGLKLLIKLNISRSYILIYAMNPLIIIELMGNLHFEGIMVFFFALSLLTLAQNDDLKSGLYLGLSVISKLVSLMFFPFYWIFLKKSYRFLIILGITIILLFAPFLLGINALNLLSSIDLYFGKFEFNGSVYLLARWLGNVITGHNLIRYLGPILALAPVMLIIYYSYQIHVKGKQNISFLIHACFFTFCIYLFSSTTVHPWYLTIPVFLSCFLKYRFAVLWSALIPLSYINYSYQVYTVNYYVIAIEYLLVIGLFVYEKRPDKNMSSLFISKSNRP